ncbi:hypothetical protein NLJ89_g11217 [Agrocybe chaxingu]|uniref:NAD(P)-binding protein n=1 Tax=Agrocybe chaxingu TaxID=84603 RepID=A0A9W8MQ70_9AGAR|nr:hypothetical protein NLJ89_g11217 [Agrocybe chaxingu]
MPPSPFVLVTPGATRGLGLALTRQFLRTTNIPVYATTRREGEDEAIKKKILDELDVAPERLNLLHLDLTSEKSIAAAADDLANSLKEKNLSHPFIHTAFITGGMLVPEKNPADLDFDEIQKTFQINTISHLLIIKHFARFLPTKPHHYLDVPSKWIHVSARVGSIEDNRLGGWFSYRASKAALNQVIKTFDVYLQHHPNMQTICAGVHPGTVKTDLSKAFWDSADSLLEPMDAASNLINVVENLKTEQRGQIWDWAGRRVPW